MAVEAHPRVDRLLRPRSVAIVGISDSPGSVGAGVLANLERFGYGGDVHLVSRSHAQVRGWPCLPTIDALPAGIDVVVLGVPRAATAEAVAACARRDAGAVLVFASGFAEAGDDGIAAQEQITRIARESGMAVAGPNCVGLTNFADGVPLTFAPVQPTAAVRPGGLAIIAQSGGMMANLRSACIARGVPVSYAISTGNEAGIGAEDYLAALVDRPEVGVAGMFMEHIRRPQAFLELAARFRSAGKPVVLLHPGRSAAARQAALSHTGALTADHDVMRAWVESAGVCMVGTMDELVDACAVLVRFPAPPTKGAAVVTDSGAFKGFALDYCEEAGLPLPGLAAGTVNALADALPEFASPDNPLDITAQGLLNPQLYADCARILLADPGTDSLVVAILPGSPQIGLRIGRGLLPTLGQSGKTVAYAVMGGDSPLAPELMDEVRTSGLPFFRSPERALRAIATVTSYGRRLAEPGANLPGTAPTGAPLRPGAMAEHEAKAWLARSGIPVPDGGTARDPHEAVAMAERVGYPVVMKAQSAELLHKTDAGGVLVGVTDAAGVRDGWRRLHERVAQARPGLQVDSVLVERMAGPGLEVVIGARRGADWGPVLVVGLGGVWIEVLDDVRILPAGTGAARIASELGRLRAAALLTGTRGQPPVDIDAIARCAEALGMLMLAHPEVTEAEINPFRVFGAGGGGIALDALAICGPAPAGQ